MKTKWHILLNPIYLGAVFLLFLNDFLLKSTYHGFITGKLSDFAGIFAFTVFGMAIFPHHAKKVAIISALWFLYWKSPSSQPFIDFFNAHFFYHIQRVVDYSDLVALLVIPFAFVYFDSSAESQSVLLIKRIGILSVSLFVFGATTRVQKLAAYEPTKEYTHIYESSKMITVKLLEDELAKQFHIWSDHVCLIESKNIWYINDIYINDKLRINVTLQLYPRRKKTDIRILEYHTCYTSTYDYDYSQNKSLDKWMEAKLKGKSKLPEVP